MSRHRVLKITLVALPVLVVVLAGAAFLVLRSAAFHRYILNTVIEEAGKSTGARVELGDFSFRLAALRVDLYRIALHGTESGLQQPLFQADHIGVGLKLISVWRHKVNLQEIVVDRPVVHLLVDPQGQSNLPQTPSPQTGSKPTNVFEMAIGHVQLNHGAIYYNDRQTALDAEVYDLEAHAAFDPVKTEYDGRLGYRQGRVRFGDYNPVTHDLDAQFGANPSGLTLNSLRLSSGDSRLTAQAHLQDYANPVVDGSYDAVISTTQLREILKNESLPAGEISTKGTIRYQNAAGSPLLRTLSAQGKISSPRLGVDTPQARASVRAIRGDYRLENGTLEVRNLLVDLLGGRLGAEATMAHLDTTPEAQVRATLQGVSLDDATAALRSKSPIRISGRLDAQIDATWRGSVQDIQVKSDARIAAATAVPPTTSAAATAIPLNAALHLAYNGRAGVLTLRQSYLRTPHTTINLDGTVSNRSVLEIHAQANDLHEIDGLVLALRSAPSSRTSSRSNPPELLGLGGSAAFDGQMQGTMKDFRVNGHLTATNFRYQRTILPQLQANVTLGPSGVELHQGSLETNTRGARGTRGYVQFDVAVAMRNWSFTPRSPINARVVANSIPFSDVQHLAGIDYPVKGLLSVNVAVHGSQDNPAGQGSARLAQASAWNQPIQDFSMQFEGDGNAIHSTVSVRTPAGSGTANLTYSPKVEAYDVKVDVPGVRIEQLEPVQSRAPGVTGVLTVSAQGRGTFKTPEFEATVAAPRLELRGQKLDGLRLQASVARQQAHFTLASNVVGANIQARGTVNLDSGYNATVNLDTQKIDLRPLFATYLSSIPGGDLHGETEVHAWLKGPLKNPKEIEAHVEVPALLLNYQSFQIAALSPIRGEFRAGILTLEHSELKGTNTDLKLQAVIPLGSDGEMQAAATGEVNLNLIQLFDPQYDSSGQLTLNVNARGTRAHPQLSGVVRISNGAFQAPGAPLGAENVNAEFDVSSERVDIKSFTAVSGGGDVTAQGSATYRPAVEFNVVLGAKHVRLRYPEGLRTVFDSTLTLNGTPAAATLNGEVLVNTVSPTQQFDLSTFADQFSGPSTPSDSGFTDNLKLNIAVRSTGQMALSSTELSVRGSADLRISGTAASPIVMGRTVITGGEIFFNGRRFQVQNGAISFVNPVRTEPVVNLQVTTTVQQFNISLNFVGPIDRLRTTYSSDPPLPPVDIINLIATGHTIQGHTNEAAASSPTTPQSLLAGQLAGQVSSRIGKLAGISSLTIDPQIGGNQSSPARLALQQRVTKNLFFTFATDVTTAQGEVVQVEYQISRRYSLSTTYNQDGQYSLQVKMHKRF